MHYEVLVDAMTKLESRGLSVSDAIKIVHRVTTAIRDVESPEGIRICAKLGSVLSKNNGYKLLKKVTKFVTIKL